MLNRSIPGYEFIQKEKKKLIFHGILLTADDHSGKRFKLKLFK